MPNETKQSPAAPESRGFIGEWTVTILMLLFGTTSLVQAFVIPTGSMETTLMVGDHLLVDKLVYSPPDAATRQLLPYRDVRRGDIIVFRYPLDLRQTYVKRAIGLPGDHVRFSGKKLILNGKMLDEPYARHISAEDVPYRDSFPGAAPFHALRPEAGDMLARYVVNDELVVPNGFVFAMGDNRENSDDSRYWGLVPRENIVGTPLLVYWSYDASTADLSAPGLGVEHLVDIGLHFFTKTRWSRSLRLVHSYPLGR